MARKRPNTAGGPIGRQRSHNARLRYAAIVGRMDQGASFEDVMKEFDVSRGTVALARKHMGCGNFAKGKPNLAKREKGPTEKVMKRLRMLAQGHTPREVAKATGCTDAAVWASAESWADILEHLRHEEYLATIEHFRQMFRRELLEEVREQVRQEMAASRRSPPSS